jgi:Hepatocellular carcinoma-associated antigen 59
MFRKVNRLKKTSPSLRRVSAHESSSDEERDSKARGKEGTVAEGGSDAADGNVNNGAGEKGSADVDGKADNNETKASKVSGTGITTTSSSSTSLSERLSQVKKRRQILTDMQYKRGLNANVASQAAATIHTDEADDGDANKTQQGQTDAAGPVFTAPSTSKEGVLQQKHKEAMEVFIRDRMSANNQQTAAEGESAASDMPAKSQPQSALYRELAQSAARMAGASGNTISDANDASTSASRPAISTEDGDVGTGGALVAGTGIAEVLLPSSERQKVIQATEQLLHDRKRRRYHNDDGSGVAVKASLPHTIHPGYRHHDQSAPDSLPHRFTMAPHRSDVTGEADLPVAHASSASALHKMDGEEVPARAVDDDRIGFDNLKRRREGHSQRPHNKARPQDKSSDDRVYKQFVIKQRDQHFRDRK